MAWRSYGCLPRMKYRWIHMLMYLRSLNIQSRPKHRLLLWWLSEGLFHNESFMIGQLFFFSIHLKPVVSLYKVCIFHKFVLPSYHFSNSCSGDLSKFLTRFLLLDMLPWQIMLLSWLLVQPISSHFLKFQAR